jgi:hypothetical protein
LNSDTSCGIAVIFTVRAIQRPTPPPIRKPTMITAHDVVERPPGAATSPTSVATTAIVMPEADSRLPLRAVAGEFM